MGSGRINLLIAEIYISFAPILVQRICSANMSKDMPQTLFAKFLIMCQCDNLLSKLATSIIVAFFQYEILQVFSEVVARYGFNFEPRALRGIFLSISINSYHTLGIDMNMEKSSTR